MAPHDSSQALLRLNILNRSAMKRALRGIDRRWFSVDAPSSRGEDQRPDVHPANSRLTAAIVP
jgi:hypothetical protein